MPAGDICNEPAEWTGEPGVETEPKDWLEAVLKDWLEGRAAVETVAKDWPEAHRDREMDEALQTCPFDLRMYSLLPSTMYASSSLRTTTSWPKPGCLDCTSDSCS